MSLVRITPPPALAVSLAELRSHLRLDGLTETEAQDASLVGFARAAQDAIDGAGGWLGRALTTQQWQMTLDCFPVTEVVTLPLPPCQSVDSLTYIDTDGATQSITNFQVYGIGGATPARLAPAYGTRWPATRRQGDAVSVVFTAGYGSFSDVPESIRAAILLTAADLYEHRGSIIAGDGFERLQITTAAESLLTPYRVW